MVTVTFLPIEVMCVTAEGGPAGIRPAWDRLESTLPSLKGRKFYGAFQPPDGPYRACVVLLPSDDPEALGLDRWTIPGGHYARKTVKAWEENPKAISTGFDELAATHKPDPSRPGIEFYRSQGEVIIFLPTEATE